MGCVCSTNREEEDDHVEVAVKPPSAHHRPPTSSIAGESAVKDPPPVSVPPPGDLGATVASTEVPGPAKSSSLTKTKSGSTAVAAEGEGGEKRKDRAAAQEQLAPPRPVSRSLESEQLAAGWPAWLASVASEAIKGWVPRRADSFEKLDKVRGRLETFATWQSLIGVGVGELTHESSLSMQ